MTLPQKKDKPCSDTIYKHMFDTGEPDGCIICGWSWDEIRARAKEYVKRLEVNRRFKN